MELEIRTGVLFLSQQQQQQLQPDFFQTFCFCAFRSFVRSFVTMKEQSDGNMYVWQLEEGVLNERDAKENVVVVDGGLLCSIGDLLAVPL